MWEVTTIDPDGNPANEGRVFVTNGKESFHVDFTGSQHLADLLNAGAKPPKEKASR